MRLLREGALLDGVPTEGCLSVRKLLRGLLPASRLLMVLLELLRKSAEPLRGDDGVAAVLRALLNDERLDDDDELLRLGEL